MKSAAAFTVIAGMILFVASGVSYGQTQSYGTDDPGIQQRIQNQQQRIQQGIDSGQLTPREAGRLQEEQAKIRQDELRMKSDGNLTPQERQKLNRELDRAGRDISREKHDSQRANVGQGAGDPDRQNRNREHEKKGKHGHKQDHDRR